MTLDPDSTSQRRERRNREDKKRMAYRRAIENYRESQALQANICDLPDLLVPTAMSRPQPLH